MVRIVTTMTVIPTREDSIIETIKSIQVGTVKPDAMYVNIPNQYVRFKQPLKPDLKLKLRELGVSVIGLEHDRACLNKILPILNHETDPETLVVTLDDDMTYTRRFIEGLYEGWKQFGDVVGYSGMYYPEKVLQHTGQLRYGIVWGHGNQADILENGFGTMFQLKHLKGFPDLPPLTEKIDPVMYISDDYIMGRFFDSVKVVKRVVCFPWIGRVGDDWSSMCTENENAKIYALAASRNSLADYIRAGQLFQMTGYMRAGQNFEPYLKGFDSVLV
jgi:hypothetical protein